MAARVPGSIASSVHSPELTFSCDGCGESSEFMKLFCCLECIRVRLKKIETSVHHDHQDYRDDHVEKKCYPCQMKKEIHKQNNPAIANQHNFKDKNNHILYQNYLTSISDEKASECIDAGRQQFYKKTSENIDNDCNKIGYASNAAQQGAGQVVSHCICEHSDIATVCKQNDGRDIRLLSHHTHVYSQAAKPLSLYHCSGLSFRHSLLLAGLDGSKYLVTAIPGMVAVGGLFMLIEMIYLGIEYGIMNKMDEKEWKRKMCKCVGTNLASMTGSCTGAWIGGTVGSIFGPIGTIIGAIIGGLTGGIGARKAMDKYFEKHWSQFVKSMHA